MNLFAQLQHIDETFGKKRQKKRRKTLEKIRTIQRRNARKTKELLAEIIKTAEKVR